MSGRGRSRWLLRALPSRIALSEGGTVVVLVGAAIRRICSSIPRSDPSRRLALVALAYLHPPSLDRLFRGDSSSITETMHRWPRTAHLLAEKNPGLKHELDGFGPCIVVGLLPFNPPVR